MPRGVQRGKYKPSNINDRIRILKAYEDERDWRSLATDLNINTRTAYDWIRASAEQQGPKPKGGAAISTKKTCELVNALIRWIEADATVTLSVLKQRLEQEFDVKVCINTVKNWLDCELISVKKLRPHIINMNSEINKLKRSEYIDQLMRSRANGRTLIWIDETNFNLYYRRTEGRSQIYRFSSHHCQHSKQR